MVCFTDPQVFFLIVVFGYLGCVYLNYQCKVGLLGSARALAVVLVFVVD